MMMGGPGGGGGMGPGPRGGGPGGMGLNNLADEASSTPALRGAPWPMAPLGSTSCSSYS
jgi:hypothetical protein